MFKVRLSPSKKKYFIVCFKIFKFLSWIFSHAEEITWLERLILKLKTSQPGQQTIAIYILLNISQFKIIQTMKFGQAIEYNKRNILL